MVDRWLAAYEYLCWQCCNCWRPWVAPTAQLLQNTATSLPSHAFLRYAASESYNKEPSILINVKKVRLWNYMCTLISSRTLLTLSGKRHLDCGTLVKAIVKLRLLSRGGTSLNTQATSAGGGTPRGTRAWGTLPRNSVVGTTTFLGKNAHLFGRNKSTTLHDLDFILGSN